MTSTEEKKSSRPGISKSYKTPLSEQYSREIASVIPGGVDSPFRSFLEVGGHTIFFERGAGSRLFDVDGNEYIDYLGAWGPAVLGYCPPDVVEACQNILARGPVFGTPHTLELEMARALIAAVPSLDMIRFVNSGTEAVMSAVRLARGFKKRDKIIMFEGCYHGHSDSVLASTGHQASTGIPKNASAHTLMVEFNNLSALRSCLSEHREEVAAVLIEPVAGSMAVIEPDPGYLEGLRQACDDFDVLLIFDEVLTGLRVAYGGAQVLYGVTPDLTCFGKALGGGMPIGAYGGRKEIMENLQPLGQVYQAGTFSGNPLTMAGGVATLKLLSNPQVYATLEARAAQLFEGLKAVIKARSLPVQLQRVGSMFSIVFCARPVRNYRDSLAIDNHAFAGFFRTILSNGVVMPPSAVDAACLSAVHSEDDVEHTIAVMAAAL